MATSVSTVQRGPGHRRWSVVLAVGAALLLVSPGAAQSPNPSTAPADPSSSAAVSSPVPIASLGAAPSGYTWTQFKLPKGADDVDVAQSSVTADGTWVALGLDQGFEDSVVWRLGPADSSVGRTKLPKSADADPRSLIRLGDQLLVLGPGKTWRSSDGSDWKTAKNKLKDVWLEDSADDGTRALIIAKTRGKDDMFVLSTSDGKEFTKAPIEAPEGKRAGLDLVALSPSGTVVVWARDLDMWDQGYDRPGYLWTSPDGVTFTPATLPFDEEQEISVAGLAATPSGFVLVASSFGRATVYTSPDGQSWTETFTPEHSMFGQTLQTVPANLGGGLLMVGDGYLYTSPDGVTWHETPTPELEGVRNDYRTTAGFLPDGRIVLKVQASDDIASASSPSVLVGTPQP